MKTSKSERKASATYHHRNLRQSAIEQAAEELKRHGDNGLGLRDLARKLGVTHAALYRHFPSKTALLAEIATEGFSRLKLALEASVSERSQRSDLCRLGTAYVQFAAEHPGYFRAMFHADLGDKTKFETLARVADEAFQHVVSAIARGQKERRYVGTQPYLQAVTAWSGVHGLATLSLAGQLQKALGLMKVSEVELWIGATDLMESGFLRQ